MDRQREVERKMCVHPQELDLLGFLWQCLDHTHGIQPPGSRFLAANTENPRPAAFPLALTLSGHQVRQPSSPPSSMDARRNIPFFGLFGAPGIPSADQKKKRNNKSGLV